MRASARARAWVQRHNYDRGVRYHPVVTAIRKADPQRAWKVLDVGSGVSGVAADLGPWFVGSVDMKPGPGVGGRVLRASALQLPFPDRSWDGVVCVDVLEHLSVREREVAITELVRVAKRLLIVAFPFYPNAYEADRALAAAYAARGMPPPPWLLEHLQHPYPDPTVIGEQICAHASGRRRSLQTRFNESLRLQRSHRLLARTTRAGYVSWSLLCGLILPLLARPLPPQASYRCVLALRLADEPQDSAAASPVVPAPTG